MHAAKDLQYQCKGINLANKMLSHTRIRVMLSEANIIMQVMTAA